jgi:hypothetical protein
VTADAQPEAAEQDWPWHLAPAAVQASHPSRLDRQRECEALDRHDLPAAGVAGVLLDVAVRVDVRPEALVAEQADGGVLATQPWSALPCRQTGQDMSARLRGAAHCQEGSLDRSPYRRQLEEADSLDSAHSMAAGHLL